MPEAVDHEGELPANLVLPVRTAGSPGITANSLMPGAIMTNLQRHVTPTSPLLRGIGGRYFKDCNEAPLRW